MEDGSGMGNCDGGQEEQMDEKVEVILVEVEKEGDYDDSVSSVTNICKSFVAILYKSQKSIDHLKL